MQKMIAKAIEYDVKQVRIFCKYINVFAENIELDPKYITPLDIYNADFSLYNSCIFLSYFS